jgi:AcrR family transcriptional regulator
MTSSQGAERPSLREEQKTVTRRRLIAAARETFLSTGFISTTVDDITAAAGVSRATFYLHFANKGAILREIAAGFIPPTTERYARLDLVLAGGFGREDLRHWVDGMLRWLNEHEREITTFAEARAVDKDLVSQHVVATADAALEAMPQFLALWPPARHAEARLRLIFLMLEIDRVAAHVTSNESFAGDRDLVIDLMCELVATFLRPEETKLRSGSPSGRSALGRRGRCRR